MNIAELLKDTPKGFKLYSPIFGEITLLRVCGDIEVLDKNNVLRIFSSDGTYNTHGECMLFPSKDNRDWNKFTIFKKGDVLMTYHNSPFIFNGEISEKGLCGSYCGIDIVDIFWRTSSRWSDINTVRIATEEEKTAFFNRLKREGYEWDACTFTLKGIKKFDINELKPFDKVLVRDDNQGRWKPAFFYRYNGNQSRPYIMSIYDDFSQCIPYNNDTKHLLGTTEDCPEYYKTW